MVCHWRDTNPRSQDHGVEWFYHCATRASSCYKTLIMGKNFGVVFPTSRHTHASLIFELHFNCSLLIFNFKYKTGGRFHQIFWYQNRTAVVLIIFDALYGKSIWPKYVSRYRSRSIKYAVQFWQKCCRNRTALFAPFTLCWCCCALHKLIGEIVS